VVLRVDEVVASYDTIHGLVDYGHANFSISEMYVDSYEYAEPDLGGNIKVKFDVYNKSSIYGYAVVYDGDGVEVGNGRIVIDKYTENISSLEEWFKTAIPLAKGLFYDVWVGNYHRLNAKKTHVELTIPKGGYLILTSDPTVDYYCFLSDTLDVFSQTISLTDRVKNIALPKTANQMAAWLQTNTTEEWAQLAFGLYADKYLDVVKDIANGKISSDVLQSAVEISADILKGANLWDIIKNSASSNGIDVLETLLIGGSGSVGQILNGMFLLGSGANLRVTIIQFGQSFDNGRVKITNK
jgi:hypothetical protein